MKHSPLKIAVFGLGYVGCVSAACLADKGLKIIGLDINPEKVSQINQGISPIIEPGVQEMIQANAASGNLTGESHVKSAIEQTDAAFICVGTPSLPNGRLSTEALIQVTHEIADALAVMSKPYTLIFRSTVEPGTVETHLIPVLRTKLGHEFDQTVQVGFHPEFMREGSAVQDFFNPCKTIIGTKSQQTADRIARIYGDHAGRFFHTSIRTAEAIKLVDNCFHALKVAFGNEMGAFCHCLGINSKELMEIFISDTRLNISPKYLMPGKPFGGSCLPKDLRAVKRYSLEKNLSLPLINGVIKSNDQRSDDILNRIMETQKKSIGFLGLSFKENTDDLRESPAVTWAETLLGKGFNLKIYDPQVNYARLIGQNKKYTDDHLPHIMELLVESIDQLEQTADLIVITKHHPEFETFLKQVKKKITVLDLVGLPLDQNHPMITYNGLYW